MSMVSNLAKDPVCGMSVTAETKHRYVHDGVEFLFCSARCRERFIENPKNFHPTVAPQEPVAIQKTSVAEWTCPMHPEIVRPEPGSCPICGMSLEPRTITLEAAGDAELRSMTRRFWFAFVLTLPLLVVVMSDMLPGRPVSGPVSPGSARSVGACARFPRMHMGCMALLRAGYSIGKEP